MSNFGTKYFGKMKKISAIYKLLIFWHLRNVRHLLSSVIFNQITDNKNGCCSESLEGIAIAQYIFCTLHSCIPFSVRLIHTILSVILRYLRPNFRPAANRIVCPIQKCVRNWTVSVTLVPVVFFFHLAFIWFVTLCV
jgi:hypothetical protein